MDLLTKPMEYADAVRKLGDKTPVGALLRSDEWASVPLAIREKTFFSAMVESAKVAQELRDRVLSATSPSEFVTKAREFMRSYGLGRDSSGDGVADNLDLTNLAGTSRLKLIYEQNLRSARGYGWWKQGQQSDVIDAFPAQELIRVEDRVNKRNWTARWAAAGGRTFSGRMIALKSDAIWREISRFGTPWPPFDFGSGMGVQDVDREVAESLGLIARDAPATGDAAGFSDDLAASVKSLDADLLAMLTDQIRDSFGQNAIEVVDGVIRWRGSQVPFTDAPALAKSTTAAAEIRDAIAKAKTREEAHAALELPADARTRWKSTNRAGPKIAAAVKTAEGFLAATVHGSLKPTYKVRTHSGRGKYDPRTKTAHVRPDAGNAVHEIAHGIEMQNPEVLKECVAFLRKRAAGEEPQQLRTLTGIPYDLDEIAFEDEWVKRGGDVYSGKVYKGAFATEILTMGLERLYNDPQGFAAKDPEFFDFIVNLVRRFKP